MGDIFEMAARGNLEQVRRFIETDGVPIDSRRKFKTALSYAAENGRIDVVRYLLDKGAKTTVPDKHGFLPIHLAAAGGFPEVVAALLDKGENINVSTIDYKETPLHIAASTGQESVVKLLLERGANVNDQTTKYGDTPLRRAAAAGVKNRNYEPTVRLLLQSGANGNLVDNYGYTPLMTACSASSSRKDMLGIITILLDAGVDISIQNNFRETALHVAAFYATEDIVRLLLERGANKNARDEFGRIPIQKARTAGIRKLLEEPLQVRKWEGYSKSDLDLFQKILDDPLNTSFCPICLNYATRQGGCMYLAHDCDRDARNETLYKKYANPARPKTPIEWCVICGRIAEFHRHFSRVSADAALPPFAPHSEIQGAAQHFQDDCVPVGGGGIVEKVRRFYRLIEQSRKLQKKKGTADHHKVRNKLIEDVWNAAMDETIPADKILLRKKFPFRKLEEAFPEQYQPPPPSEYPDILRPADEAHLTPIKHERNPNANIGAGEPAGNECDVELGPHPDNRPVYQFRHKQPDGSISNHGGMKICGPDLENQLRAAPINGMCPFCAVARLYPEEIRGIVSPEFYERYRKEFNRIFRPQAGGSMEESLTEDSILRPVDMSTADCSLPPIRGARRLVTPHRKRNIRRQTFRKRRFSRRK